MKLLLDNNVSPRLVRRLGELYPGTTHVRSLNLQSAADETIWQEAAAGGFIIVGKDDDFRQFAFLHGAPPKVIWLRLGNCTTDDVERVLRSRRDDIAAFNDDPDAALLVLTHPA